MRIAIIGSGAMGSLFAGRLNPLSEIIMIGNWTEQLATLARHGLRLIENDGREIVERFAATKLRDGILPADLAIVLVKSSHTERAAKQIKQILKPNGHVLTLQNGLGNLEIISSVVGGARASLGVTSEGATMLRPGVVRHAGYGHTHLAYTPKSFIKLSEIAKLFNSAGFTTELVDNPRSLIWGKLAVNAGINPLTGLLQVSNGFLLKHDVTKTLMIRAAEEAATVAGAQGIQLPYASVSERVAEVASNTAANRSSMAQDIARGVPTEIQAIAGAIVARGREFNIATPINSAFFYLITNQFHQGEWRSQVKRLDRDLQLLFNALAKLANDI